MPNDTPIMRAPTKKEKVGDFIRGAYDAVAEQPLSRIADIFGMGAGAMRDSVNAPPPEVMGAMPGPPLAGVGARLGQRAGITKALSPERAVAARPAAQGMPPEFQAMESPHFAPSKHAVSLDQMPSGKMEYLDPDVSAIMGGDPTDFTNPKAMQWLRAVLGK
jgi:hypothetical protein